jgi:hypothetical protein
MEKWKFFTLLGLELPFPLVVQPVASRYTDWAIGAPVRCFFIIIQFFIIYVPSQQLQGQLQTQYSVDTGNCIVDKHNIKSKTNYGQVLEEKHINAEK